MNNDIGPFSYDYIIYTVADELKCSIIIYT